MNEAPSTLLLIGENPDEPLWNLVDQATRMVRCELVRVDSLDGALTLLRRGGIDVVLLVQQLPDGREFGPVRTLRTDDPAVPIVILGRQTMTPSAQEWVEAGAYDCLWVDQAQAAELARILHHALEQRRLLRTLDQRTRDLHAVEVGFRNLIDQDADGIIVVDQWGMIRFANPAAETLFGRRNSDLQQAVFGLPVTSGETAELDILRGAADNVSVEMRVVEGEWEGQRTYLVTLRNITKRKQSEDQLRKLSQAVEQSASIVFITDTHGSIEYVNPKFTQVTGYTADEVVGKNPRILKSGTTSAEAYRALWTTISSGDEWRGELLNRKKNGELYWVSASMSPIKDADGITTHFLAIEEDITVRKHAEEALRQSEARFRAMFLGAGIGMALLDPGGRILETNPALQELLGYNAEELHGMIFSKITHPDDLNLDLDLFKGIIAGEYDNYQMEKRYIRKDGRTVWGNATTSLIPDASTGLQLYIGMVEDITPRKQAERAEYEQRTLAEALRDMAAALNSTLDLDEVLDRLLVDVERVLLHDAADIMLIEGDTVRIVRSKGYAERDLEEWIKNLRFSLADTPGIKTPFDSGQPLVIPDTQNDPRWIIFPENAWIRSHIKIPIRREGQVIGFLNLDSSVPDFFRDVRLDQLQAFADQAAIAIHNAQLYDAVRRHATELEQRVQERTAELEQQHAQLQAILDAMGEGVIYIDTNNRVKYINRTLARLVGYSVAEFLGHPTQAYETITEAMENAEEWRKTVRRAIEHGGTWRGELQLQRKDGSKFDASGTVTAVMMPTGPIIGRVEVIRDISQEKALQVQKDRFIANASHELRTPLTNLKMRLYLARKQPFRLSEHLEVVEQVTDRMENLVDDLLDISRFERGIIVLDRAEVVLQDLISHVVMVQQPHADQKNIRLMLDLPSTPLRTLADPKRLIQVFTNLIINAINYTREEGSVAVQLRAHRTGNGDYAFVRVQDSGVGIQSKILPQIFEPFFRATESGAKGTGLGLTISKEIVESHGGEIMVESEIGKGSTFTVKLALLKEPKASSG